jgi:DNA helicase-2/ATP-dependent DNA helicase PcrA
LKNRTLSVPPKAGHLPQEGEKNKDELSWNDFAVLIRANAAANELLPILTHNGIPFTFVANRGLYKKPIVVDVLAYMNLLNNFHDSTALFRVLNLPKFHLPQQEISTLLLLAHKKTLSLFEAIQLAVVSQDLGAESKTKIQTLKDLLLKHSAALKTSTAAEMMVKTVKDLGLEQKLLEDTLENAENRELLEQFYKKIEDFEKDDADKSLHSFLSFLDLEMQAGSDGIIKFDPNLGPESLKILTIHSAKGLEFKYVFLINLVDQRFPTREKGESIEIPEPLIKDILPEGDFHLQEERRLFYVAVTRAKQHLYLSWAKDYGGVRAKKPSQFLIETKLVPSDKVSKATGKVFFGRPEKTKVVYQTLPSQFSYSQLNDFQTCPLKYKYQHYLKLPVPGSPALSFGSTMHKVFEEYLKLYKNQQQISQADLFGKQAARMLPGLKTLEELYAKNWIDDWYENKLQKDEYRKLGRQMLQTFYESIETQKPKPKYIEQFFKLPLGDYTFVGKIDRADETTAGLEILDYKTGKAPKSSKDLDQLYIYQWVVQDFLKEKVIGLKYWYLQDNQLLSEEPANQEEIAKLKAKLLKLIEEIVDATKYDKFRELHKNSPKHKCDFTNFG